MKHFYLAVRAGLEGVWAQLEMMMDVYIYTVFIYIIYLFIYLFIYLLSTH